MVFPKRLSCPNKKLFAVNIALQCNMKHDGDYGVMLAMLAMCLSTKHES